MRLLIAIALAALSWGQSEIIMSNEVVDTPNVTYTFILQLNRSIPAGGKIVVRFPRDFSDSFNWSVGCTVSGSSTGCTWNPDIDLRMLTIPINSGLTPNNPAQFTASGITNPKYATTSSVIEVTSYSSNGSSYTLIENLGSTILPKPGALSAEAFTWQTGTSKVAAFSNLVVDMKTEHSIPKNGKIIVEFPKWNSFNITPD
jgi:hypothetical protein